MPARLFPVFRDREELPTTSDLSHAIDDALRSSLFLIVMCSPSAAASQWVNEEIRAFKHLHGEDQILAIIVDGEPNATDKGAPEDECFPEALRFRLDPGGRLTTERTEPIAADARPQGDGKEDALLKLLSGLLAVNFNDLKQREIQAARKRARIAQGIAAAMALLAIAALGAGWVAFQNQQIAEEQTAIAIAQRQIAEAETRRADAARKVADEQRQIAEARLREALIERTGRTIADGRAAAQQGAVETAMANAHAALASALDIEDAALTAQAAQFGRDLVLDDRLEAVLEGRYPVGLAIPRLRNAEISETGNVIMVRRGDQLLLWQRLTGALLLRLKGVETAAFRPDGGIGGILAGGQVFAVAPDTGQATLVKTLTAGSGAPAPVSRASASPGGRFAAVLSGDALSLVDLITGNTARILALDGGATRQFAWSADGRYLAAIDSEPPRARFWSTESRNAVADITPAGAVNAIRIDQDIALIDADGGLGIVNLLTGQTAIPADVNRVDDILIGADGRVIVAPALGPPLVLSPDGVTETTVGTEAVFGLVGLRADGREVLVRGATQFALHDVETGDLIRKIGPSGSVPAAFHLAKSGDYLAILGEDGVVTVWSLGDGRQTFTYRPQHRVEWLTMLDAPMGALLMIQNREGSVSLHRAEPSRLFGTGLVSFDAPLANGLIAVNGYYPTPARLWDIATRHPVSDLPGPVMAADPATGRLLTRDGADLAVTHLDANKVELHAREPRIVHATFGANEHLALQTPEAVLLINTKTGATLGKWSAVAKQNNAKARLAFSPDGSRLAFLAGDDQLVVIETKTAARTVSAPLGSASASLSFSVDGATIWITGDNPEDGWRFALGTNHLTPAPGQGAFLAAGEHLLLRRGEGTALHGLDATTGEQRFSLESLGHTYAVGKVDDVILSYIAADTLRDEPGRLRAQDAQIGTVLWEIEGERHFTAPQPPAILSDDEAWALAAHFGPGDAALVDVTTGQITATLPKTSRTPNVIAPSLDGGTVVLSDLLENRAFDLRAAQVPAANLVDVIARLAPKPETAETAVTECDRLAAHPDDPSAITPGRAVEDIPLEAAHLCQQALATIGTGPDAARLTYQLSRALDATGQSNEAIVMLERLAARDYAMADHALGIWRLGGVGGGPDEAAVHFRRAAAAGVGASWVVLSRMAAAEISDVALVDGDAATILQKGADAGSPDALHALALAASAEGRLTDAYDLAQRAADTAAPHRHQKFQALAATLARRLSPNEGLSK